MTVPIEGLEMDCPRCGQPMNARVSRDAKWADGEEKVTVWRCDGCQLLVDEDGAVILLT